MSWKYTTFSCFAKLRYDVYRGHFHHRFGKKLQMTHNVLPKTDFGYSYTSFYHCLQFENILHVSKENNYSQAKLRFRALLFSLLSRLDASQVKGPASVLETGLMRRLACRGESTSDL